MFNLVKQNNSTRVTRLKCQGAEKDSDKFDKMILDAIALQGKGKLDDALKRWQEIRKNFPNQMRPYSEEAALLYSVKKYQEANSVLQLALTRWPQELGLLMLGAYTAYALNDFVGTARRLVVIDSDWKDRKDARTFVETFKNLIPKELLEVIDNERVNEIALSKITSSNWQEALQLLKPAYVKAPQNRSIALNYGIVCRELGDYDLAENVLSDAKSRYPDDAEVAANYAQVALKAGRYDEAAIRWRDFLTNFPNHLSLAHFAAEALVQINCIDEARDLLNEALLQFPDSIEILIKRAHIAAKDEDWPKAIELWEGIARKSPDDIDIRNARGHALWHAGFQDKRPSLGGSTKTEEAVRDLMLQFEGLGDNCEFGFVQRHFGAEPLGLFRFSAIKPEALISLIQSCFAELGDVSHTRLHFNQSDESMVVDDRGFYQMHTFIRSSEEENQAVLKKQIKRINYLKRELLAEFEAGKKIFVCKDSDKPISHDVLSRLSKAIGEHNRKNILLGIRVATETNRAGSVERFGNNILIGYVSSVYQSQPDALGSIDFDAWKEILKRAVQMRHDMHKKLGRPS